MKRREAIAGATSLGILGTGGFLLTQGVPGAADEPAGDGGDSDDDGDAGWGDGPIELETLDVPGSEAGTLPVPNDTVTVLSFVTPSCGTCRRSMPHFGEAVARLRPAYAGGMTAVSVSTPWPEDDLEDWWNDYGGDWYLGYDPRTRLSTRYRVTGYPTFLAIDPEGEVRWEDDGVIDADRTIRRLERVLEEFVTDDTDPGDDPAAEAADDSADRTDDATTESMDDPAGE